MDYEEYEKECKRIRKVNKKLLNGFNVWLSSMNLSPKTIAKHNSNIDFFINEFLLYEETSEAIDGVEFVDMFLGYWFIKKAMWANKSAIKENAASLKKFYQYLYKEGKVSVEDVTFLKEEIKEGMPEWLSTMSRYDNPDIEDMGEVWDI